MYPFKCPPSPTVLAKKELLAQIARFQTTCYARLAGPISGDISKPQECKALVVWGTILGSSVGYGRLTKQVRYMIVLPPYQYSVLVGLLLSDGWLSLSTKTSVNARFGFRQSSAQFEYVWFVFNDLSHYCERYPYSYASVRRGIAFYHITITTRVLPCFTELYSIFYPNKVKVIPEDIYNMLTPVALAHMIMGDGSVQRHGLTICTDSYTLPDVVRLMNVLMIRYELDCRLRMRTPTQTRIYIRQGSMSKLRTIVGPYTYPSMMFKLTPKATTEES